MAAFMLLQEEKRMYLEVIPGHCKFISTLDIFSEIKSTFDNKEGKTEQEIIKFYREVPLLVLDDFGTRKPTDWVYDVLYLIINYRYEWMLPTIFTSNLNLNEISKVYGDDRLTSRIERMGKVLKLQKY
jgi:DNA replication protein DnaC